MKTRFGLSLLLFGLTALVVSSCQKESSTKDHSTETSIHSEDQNRFSGEVDAAANDVVLTLDATAGFSGRDDGWGDLRLSDLECERSVRCWRRGCCRAWTDEWWVGNVWGARLTEWA